MGAGLPRCVAPSRAAPLRARSSSSSSMPRVARAHASNENTRHEPRIAARDVPAGVPHAGRCRGAAGRKNCAGLGGACAGPGGCGCGRDNRSAAVRSGAAAALSAAAAAVPSLACGGCRGARRDGGAPAVHDFFALFAVTSIDTVAVSGAVPDAIVRLHAEQQIAANVLQYLHEQARARSCAAACSARGRGAAATAG